MENCIKKYGYCLDRDGKDYRRSRDKCCLEELVEDKEVVQNVIDTLADSSKDNYLLQKVASKLSYASHILNHNNETDLLEVFPFIKKYAVLLFESNEQILEDSNICSLIFSLNIELEKWFQIRFLDNGLNSANTTVSNDSIIADIQTVEMLLGKCEVQDLNTDESFDDIFF